MLTLLHPSVFLYQLADGWDHLTFLIWLVQSHFFDSLLLIGRKLEEVLTKEVSLPAFLLPNTHSLHGISAPGLDNWIKRLVPLILSF